MKCFKLSGCLHDSETTLLMEQMHLLPMGCALVFSALFLGAITTSSEASIINVVHSTGNGSLYYHLCHDNASISSGTELLLDPDIHHILPEETFCLLRDIFNLTITSSSPNTTAQVICKPWNGMNPVPMTGLGFLNATNLRMSNINFTNCGGLLSPDAAGSINDSSLYLKGAEAAVLYLSHCHSVSIEQINMTGSYGYGVLLANVFGNSSMRDLKIGYSGSDPVAVSPAFENMTSIGSGVLVYYFNSSLSSLEEGATELSLKRISLQMNVNIIQGLDVCINGLYPPESYTLPQQPLLTAAGVTLIYRQNTFPVQVKLLHSLLESNFGTIGGGMMVLYLDTVRSSYTLIDNSTTFKQNDFLNNACHGAAINTYSFFSHSFIHGFFQNLDWIPLTIANSLIMDHIGFTKGSGFNDETTALGAVYLGSVFQQKLNVTFQIHNTDFKNNLAIKTGTCLYAETLLGMSTSGITMSVDLRDINAENNNQSNTETDASTASLFAFSNVGKANIHGSSTNSSIFQKNLGSVFYAFRSNMYLSGHLVFRSNQARNGAAFRLHGGSHIFLTQGVKGDFIDNIAGEYGGSIFTQSDSDENMYCSIQIASEATTNFSALNICLNFQGNHAGWSGGSVFASPVYNCRMYNSFNSKEVYRQAFQFQKDDKNPQVQFVSNPVNIRIFPPTRSVEVYPGQTLNLSLSARDQANNSVFTAVFLAFGSYGNNSLTHPMRNTKWWLHPSQRVQILNSTDSMNISEWPIVTATVHVANSCINEPDENKRCSSGLLFVSIPDPNPKSRISLVVHLQPCPLGFELSANNGVCNCAAILQRLQAVTKVSFHCDINQQLIIQREGIPLCPWLGTFKQQFAIAYNCPLMFCKCTSLFNMSNPNFTSCSNHRTGPLCGSCPENLSVVFGSDKCQQCSDVFLVSILLYAVLGLILVLILFTLKMTLTVGTINGIIFFANLSNTGLFDVLEFPSYHLSTATLYIKVFLSLLNLNLGFPLCFYNGMTEIQKAFFQFAFPVYLLSLIGVLVIVSRWSSQVSSFTSKGVIPVLVTLLHLSFSRLLLTVVDSFAWSYIYTSSSDHSHTVWFRDGSVKYNDPTHIALMGVSAASVVLFLLPYFILLLGARVWICISLISKHLKPLFDAILAPYREGKKHWFGARLVFLAAAYIVYAFYRGGGYFYLIIIINGSIITSFNIFHACARPFKYYLLNLLDSWIMANISVLYVSTTYFIFNGMPKRAHLLAFVMTNLTFITFLGIILFHILWVTGLIRKLKRVIRQLRRHRLRSRTSTQPLNQGSHVVFHYQAVARNTFGQDSFEVGNAELREPVLSFISTFESTESS